MPCVHGTLWRAGHCWSFGVELTLNRPPVHLTTHKRNRHTGSWSELHLESHITLSLVLYVLIVHPPTEVKSQMHHSNCLSVTVQLFIVQSNQHLSLFLSSHLPLNICLYLPRGNDSLVSPNEQVSATLTANNWQMLGFRAPQTSPHCSYVRHCCMSHFKCKQSC